MLQVGRLKLLLDTVPEGVLVTVYEGGGFLCEVVDSDARSAVMSALEAAEMYDDAA